MALGRGLGELLGEIETAYEKNNTPSRSEILEINVNHIKLNPYQPRKIFKEDKLRELSESIVNNGLLQPIVVTKDSGNYLLISGERRLRATKLANIHTIKALVLNVDNDKLRELALIEIAYSYESLLNDYNITHEELSKRVSKSRSSISNMLRILTLSTLSLKMLGDNKISLGHAKLIVGLMEDEQKLVIDSIIGQKLSVRETEVLVKRIKKRERTPKKTLVNKINFNYNSLVKLKKKLNQNNLNVKIDDKYFKIKINSQEDIENISKAFENK